MMENWSNEVMKIDNTITSLEIAKFTGKRHADVLRDIRNLEDAYVGVFGEACRFALLEEIRPLPQGGSKKYKWYALNKSQCTYIVTSYNPTVRALIQRRWEELESAALQSKPIQHEIPTTFAEALKLAASQAEALEEMKPKVEYYESALAATNTFTSSEVSCAIKEFSSPQDLNSFLVEHGVITSRGCCRGVYRLRTRYEGKGYTQMRTIPLKSIVTHQLRWTEKGIEFIRELVKKKS